MKHFLHIAVLLVCPLLAFSQYYVKGQVREEGGRVLPNVNIYLHSNHYVYYSGAEGKFGIITSQKIDTITVYSDGFQKQKLTVDAEKLTDVVLKKATGPNSSRVYKLSSLTQNLARDIQQQWTTGDETYADIVENQFIHSSANPSTGLTMNVDRASYSNARRFLLQNSAVPPDAVRLEEMLNYFNFNYTEPAQNKLFEFKSFLTDCPWNKSNHLIFTQVNSKRLALDSLPPSHLVFLIDISASMDKPERLPLLKSGFKSLVNNLRGKDSVSIIVYGGTVGIALAPTGGNEKEKIFATIDSLQCGGSTPGESGIKLAYSVARHHFIKGGNNRIILATDGDFNVGLKTDEELEQMILEQKQSGIYLTCLGIGMGNYKDSKILALAQKGNGNFAYIDSYAEAEKVLLKEFTQTLFTVADDAYLSVQFDPALVQEYRLVGFDNKLGAIKDAEAIVEGGEIGSAYSAMAAFEVVLTEKGRMMSRNGEAFLPGSFTLQYRLPSQAKLNQLMEKPSMQFIAFESAPKWYRFASAVLMFGEMLRQSKFVKEVNWNSILQIAAASYDPGSFSQKEFLLLVEKAKSIYGNKRRK